MHDAQAFAVQLERRGDQAGNLYAFQRASEYLHLCKMENSQSFSSSRNNQGQIWSDDRLSGDRPFEMDCWLIAIVLEQSFDHWAKSW